MFRSLFIFSFLLSFQSFNYRDVFKDDYVNAVKFMSDNSGLLFACSDSFNTDPEIILPVLFPEAIRYSIIKDFIETKSLEITYVYSGSADFSIGFFQMKPSFAESLENTIISYPAELSKYDSLIIAKDKSLPQTRKIRIERLKSIEYQIVYANCFYDVVKILYPEIFTFDIENRIRFISTAFNHGFLSGEEEIIEFANKAFFPLNGKNKSDKYVYSDISLFFYHNDLSQIVSKKK